MEEEEGEKKERELEKKIKLGPKLKKQGRGRTKEEGRIIKFGLIGLHGWRSIRRPTSQLAR